MTQVNIETLEAAGYRWYRDGLYADKEDNLGLWHKTFSDGLGQRFSLAVRVWRRDAARDPSLPPMSFSPTAQFNTASGTTVNLAMIHGDESLEEVEAFYQKAFDAMAFAYAKLDRGD